MANKYKVGDKVVIKRVAPRTPKDLLKELRLDHQRTIVGTFYDKTTQHTRYYLGSNRMGLVDLSNVPLRASQLKFWIRGNNGRPKTKRAYRSPYG